MFNQRMRLLYMRLYQYLIGVFSSILDNNGGYSMEFFIVFLLMSLFSIVIVFITIHSLIKVFNIAIERREISKQNYRISVSSSILVGVSVATALPLGYYKLVETLW